MSTDKPKARKTDPATSHQAANSIESDTIRRSQADVVKAMRRVGPCQDPILIDEIITSDRYHPQSESGIRTRRKELVTKGIIVDTGDRVLTDSGRKAIVWGLKTRQGSSA